jgi:GT2 family glycosyltransferase
MFMTALSDPDLNLPDDSTDAPTISVLMPCYNASDTVDQAIASIREQTFSEWELIAVDDGSEDDTLSQLHRWAERDPRIHALAKDHSGIIPSLNIGLETCRAPFVARMDADDLAHRQRLAKQVQFMHRRPSIAVVSCLVEAFPAEDVREGFRIYLGWLNALTTPETIAREIYIESPLPHPSVLMRREWITRMGGYQEHGWPEDYDLWLRMHRAGAQFAKVPEVLLQWREHGERLTRTDSRYSVENFLRAKAHYLCAGPLRGSDGVILWGAGQMGRRISKHLQRGGAELAAFVDIDPDKIGRQRRGCPIIPQQDLPAWLDRFQNPVVLAAVGSRGARETIRSHLKALGLIEGKNWWAVA